MLKKLKSKFVKPLGILSLILIFPFVAAITIIIWIVGFLDQLLEG